MGLEYHCHFRRSQRIDVHHPVLDTGARSRQDWVLADLTQGIRERGPKLQERPLGQAVQVSPQLSIRGRTSLSNVAQTPYTACHSKATSSTFKRQGVVDDSDAL